MTTVEHPRLDRTDGFVRLPGRDAPLSGRAAAISQLEAGRAAIVAGAVDAGLQCLRRAVVEAAASRLNPVVNVAGTTVLGVLPMLQDVFWVALAVTIFFGLIVGTVLTMVMVPTLYALLYRIPSE